MINLNIVLLVYASFIQVLCFYVLYHWRQTLKMTDGAIKGWKECLDYLDITTHELVDYVKMFGIIKE